MTDQKFQLSTPQICAIFSHIPSATKVFVSSSAQGYPACFVGDVASVLKMLSHEAQEEFPQLNVRDTSESSVTPMSIDAVHIVFLSIIVDSFDATEEYCVELDCNLGETNDLLPSIQYLEAPVGPNPAYRIRRPHTQPLEGENPSDDVKRFVDERIIEISTQCLQERRNQI